MTHRVKSPGARLRSALEGEDEAVAAVLERVAEHHDADRQQAKGGKHVHRHSYANIYRKMVAGQMTLRERGLAIYDLGDIFAGEKGTIYADQIHYWRDDKAESPGNRTMA